MMFSASTSFETRGPFSPNSMPVASESARPVGLAAGQPVPMPIS